MHKRGAFPCYRKTKATIFLILKARVGCEGEYSLEKIHPKGNNDLGHSYFTIEDFHGLNECLNKTITCCIVCPILIKTINDNKILSLPICQYILIKRVKK